MQGAPTPAAAVLILAAELTVTLLDGRAKGLPHNAAVLILAAELTVTRVRTARVEVVLTTVHRTPIAHRAAA